MAARRFDLGWDWMMSASRSILSLIALCLGFVLWMPSTPQGLPGITEAQAGSPLYRKCRKAVFDKYGQRKVKSGRPVRSLPSRFVQGQVDACVANGGRVV
jgi:hypothetical protein